MAEQIINSQSNAPVEPELRQDQHKPRGVIRKNQKMVIYLCAAGLVIAAAVFSSIGTKAPAQKAAEKHEPPQPMVQDNTDNNVQDLKNQFATEKQQAAQQAGLTPAQAATMSAYSPTGQQTPCLPGQNCPQQQNGYGQAVGATAAFSRAAGGTAACHQRTAVGLRFAVCIEPCLCAPCQRCFVAAGGWHRDNRPDGK